MPDGHSSTTHTVPLVLVGASGSEGMRQLVEFVRALPTDLQAAVAVVLHRPADRPSHLPHILARSSRIPIVVPKEGQPLEAGHCYLADSDHHLAIGPHQTARLVRDHRFRNRTIDLLFKTAAEEAGAGAMGVILAGSLRDGSEGLRAISGAGGTAFVIDSVWAAREGMPRAAILAAPAATRESSGGQLAAAVTSALGRIVG